MTEPGLRHASARGPDAVPGTIVPRTILLATDLTPTSLVAETEAITLARDLHAELAGYPGGSVGGTPTGLVVPLRFDDLAFFSITSVLGTPLDVTLAELAVESFLPADAATAAALHRR